MLVKGNNNYTAFNSLTINYGTKERTGVDCWGLAISASVSDSIAAFDDAGNVLHINNAWGTLRCSPQAIRTIERYTQSLGCRYINSGEVSRAFEEVKNTQYATDFVLAMYNGTLITCVCAPVFADNGEFCGVIFVARRNAEKLLCQGDDCQSRHDRQRT